MPNLSIPLAAFLRRGRRQRRWQNIGPRYTRRYPGGRGELAVTFSRELAASVASLVAAGLLALAPHNAAAQAVAVSSGTKGKLHLLPATLETTQWGWFNNAQPPVLRIDSGDTVVLETMMHSHNQV